MVRFALPLVAFAALTAPLSAAEIEIEADGLVVELVITEVVESEPDGVTFSAGVTQTAPSAAEAARMAAIQMNALLEAIEAMGIPDENVQTGSISLSPKYSWDGEAQTQRFAGYIAGNLVTVKLANLDRIGSVLDTVIAAGATNISGLSWTVDDADAAREQARLAALETGRARAMTYAAATGHDDVALLRVTEADDLSGFGIAYAVAEAAMYDVVSETPVRPAMVQTAVTITMSFEMIDGDADKVEDE